jgi:myo-inositol-1-phosphate synthase
MDKLGICVAGIDGAVGSTLAAGLALLRRGLATSDGLISETFGERLGLADLRALRLAGWDPRGETLLDAALRNRVVPEERLEPVARELRALRPWRAPAGTAARRRLEAARDIDRFRRRAKVDRIVVVNLIPTGAHRESRAYALAALDAGCPFVNFTPNECGEEALVRIPFCGRDGKTGQTWLKSVLAPALRGRALRITGWYSTNLLGNEDGKVVGDPERGKAKILSKLRLLPEMLGYEPHHQVQINYYPPRGDDKESWDAIDFEGFLGLPMAIKVNGLWRDSVLAAPMCLDLARFIDLAARRGERGPQEWLSFFFKSPYRAGPGKPVHDAARQERMLLEYLEAAEERSQGVKF